ncbi:hypothetical protein MMC14_004550 [Varicellaria rhodocarpa]|nr:hypothetical protein [Varicellaria rhodocarpa]
MAPGSGSERGETGALNGPAADVSREELSIVELVRLDTRPLGSFSKDEQQLLDLYDCLQELRLERALLEVQRYDSEEMDFNPSDDEIEARIKAVERDCVETRSIYCLRNSIVQNVLVTNPTLKAIHSSTNANSTEKALHPLLDRRDVLTMAHKNLSTSLQSILNALSEAETQNLIYQKKNKVLADDLLTLAGKLQEIRVEEIEDPQSRIQLEHLRSDTKESKRKRRVMKSVVGAIIAGSGVEWAHDDELRDLVLNDED